MGGFEFRLFTPEDGGLGAFLSCTSVSARAAFPSPANGSVYCVNNQGLDNVSLAFGRSDVVATNAYLTFPPGLTYIGVPNAGGGSAPTHFAGITTGATVPVQITLGTLTVV